MTQSATIQFETSNTERRAVAAVLELLARFWARELDRAELMSIVQSEMAVHWKLSGGWLPTTALDVTEPLVDDMAVDYCQLIVGPRHQIPPVQSVWMSGSYGNDSAQSMQQFVDALPGFVPCCPVIDHFAVQLQYAAALFSIERAKLETAEHDSLDLLTDRFYQSHMQWPGRFLDLVEEAAQTWFYEGLARVTRNTLAMIRSQFNGRSVTLQSP